MDRSSSGFTLIEAMIVVAILGIILALSIPLYTGYVAKSQINRAVSELGHYRVSVEEAVGESKPVSNGDIGYTPSDITNGDVTTDIATLNPDGSGHLQVTLGGSAHPSVTDVIIILERTSDGRWECVVDTSANTGGWSDAYLPAGCRL